MAISPVNIARVSHNLRSIFVLDSVRRTQQELLLSQARISSGRRFVSPGEDPIAASRSIDLTQALNRQDQWLANIRHGDNLLSFSDNVLTELNDLLIEASVIASQTVGNLTSADERAAEAEVVARIRDQIVAVGNRTFGGRFVFGGRDTINTPFVESFGGVAYVGDLLGLSTRVDGSQNAEISVPGNVLFGALSASVASGVDLTPVLRDETRLDTITGAAGRPIQTGTLVFSEQNGANTFQVDLSGADTIGDVVTLINSAASAAGSSLTASLDVDRLVITPGGSAVSITDTSAGAVATSLGILTKTPTTSTIDGQTLTPRLTRLTSVEDMAGGATPDLASGIIITNGTRSASIDFSDATTVQDIINTINNAGVGVLARISNDGRRIDLFNTVSGSSLTVGENGGTTAADLGLRTLTESTPLAVLNFGRGVGTVEGQDDLRITASDGSTFDVNLDGAETLGDVIEAINQAADDAGVALTAEMTPIGNGIRLVDSVGGPDSPSVGSLNLSTAATDLGLASPASVAGNVLIGHDVRPVRTEGIIAALFDLERALRADDTQAITDAGARLDELTNAVTNVHGMIGARAQAMRTRLSQMEAAAATTQIILSRIQDVDFAEAVTTMQAAMTQLQANLQTGASLMNLSLMDFLR